MPYSLPTRPTYAPRLLSAILAQNTHTLTPGPDYDHFAVDSRPDERFIRPHTGRSVQLTLARVDDDITVSSTNLDTTHPTSFRVTFASIAKGEDAHGNPLPPALRHVLRRCDVSADKFRDTWPDKTTLVATSWGNKECSRVVWSTLVVPLHLRSSRRTLNVVLRLQANDFLSYGPLVGEQPLPDGSGYVDVSPAYALAVLSEGFLEALYLPQAV